MQGLASFGGPFKIPGLINRNGPNFVVNYQWVHNRNASTQPGLMPTPAQRAGDFSSSPVPVLDPSTHLPFPGNIIPSSQISPQALALLNLYPLPNFAGSTRYNYQIPLINGQHQDSVQARMNKQVKRNQFTGTLGLQNTRTDNTNLFGFLDNGRTLGMNLQLGWRHQFTPRAFVNFGYQFSRFSATNIPFFCESRKCRGPGGDHRQQSGAAELGAAGALLRRRNYRPERFAVLGDSQPDRRRFLRWPVESRTPQYNLWSGFPPPAIQHAVATGSAGIVRV